MVLDVFSHRFEGDGVAVESILKNARCISVTAE